MDVELAVLAHRAHLQTHTDRTLLLITSLQNVCNGMLNCEPLLYFIVRAIAGTLVVTVAAEFTFTLPRVFCARGVLFVCLFFIFIFLLFNVAVIIISSSNSSDGKHWCCCSDRDRFSLCARNHGTIEWKMVLSECKCVLFFVQYSVCKPYKEIYIYIK